MEDLRNNDASDWTVVMGNEAGDLDSSVFQSISNYFPEKFRRKAERALCEIWHRLVSALALAYAFTHSDPPVKAIALLQTEQGELDVVSCIVSQTFGKLIHSRLHSQMLWIFDPRMLSLFTTHACHQVIEISSVRPIKLLSHCFQTD